MFSIFVLLALTYISKSIIIDIQLQFLDKTPCLTIQTSQNSQILYEGDCPKKYSYSLTNNVEDDVFGTTYTSTLRTKADSYTHYYYAYIKGYVYVDGYKFNIKENTQFFSSSSSFNAPYQYPEYYSIESKKDTATFSFTINHILIY